MYTQISLRIPHDNKVSRNVVLPEDPAAWAAGIQRSLNDGEGLNISLDTLSEHTGYCDISFESAFPTFSCQSLEDRTAFGFSVSVEKLAELIQALRMALRTLTADDDAPADL